MMFKVNVTQIIANHELGPMEVLLLIFVAAIIAAPIAIALWIYDVLRGNVEDEE